MKVNYNAPLTLTFTILSTIIFLLNHYVSANINLFFSVPGSLEDANIANVLGIVTHVLGHASLDHLLSNLAFILILGPILEEKYGTFKLFVMMIVTALVTGVLNIVLFDTGLLGASGIVFMMILLSSITNRKAGEIPLTFILVLVLYLGKEVLASFDDDQISQFGHLIGGVCGGIFGLLIFSPTSSSSKTPSKSASKDKKSLLDKLNINDKKQEPLDY